MKMKHIFKIIFLTALFSFNSYAEEIRDPFSPFEWNKQTVEAEKAAEAKYKGDLNATPLTKEPIFLYQVTGIIKSKKKSLALVKAKNKREYFVKTKDKIGNEGGHIDKITADGISVDIDGKLIELTVSNRFDAQNDN